MLVREAPAEHLGWLAERAGLTVHPALRAIEAIDDVGRIHGMVGLDGWAGNTVCLHIALENPAALRSLAYWGFRAAFVIAGRGVALVQVVSNNTRSLRLVERLGFRRVHTVPNGWRPGIDMVWFEMQRDECRWLPVDMRKVA